jgi:LPS-assembly lipoprotein
MSIIGWRRAGPMIEGPRVTRRGVLLAAGAGCLSSLLPGCGFQLRRPPELRLKSLHLAGFGPLSPMADELRRQLRASPQVQVVEAASQAEVVLYALQDAREQVVAASTATGQVRELTLRARLRFRATNGSGKEVIPETELVLTRDMSYSESAAMAKDHEAEMLFRAMQADIATQVLRRLAALGPAPAAPAAAASAS